MSSRRGPELYIAGTGSFALEVVEYAQSAGHQVAGLVELIDRERIGGRAHGLEIAGPEAGPGTVVVGLGGDRLELWALLAEHGWSAGKVVHPAAHVSPSAVVGEGLLVGPGAVIGAAAVLGPHALVGRGALVGHHARVGPGGGAEPGSQRRRKRAYRRGRRAGDGLDRRQRRRGRRRGGRGRGRGRRTSRRARDPRPGSACARLLARVSRRLAHALDRRFESLHHRVERSQGDARGARRTVRRRALPHAPHPCGARLGEPAAARRGARRSRLRARLHGAGAARDGDPADLRASRAAALTRTPGRPPTDA